MRQRFQLTPQMIDYTRLKPEWVPHLMYNYEPNFRSNVCNTDEHGFRYTYKDGHPLNFATFTESDGSKAILCGGSTAFGTGATSDRAAIASRLNEDSTATWLNFAGPAHTSTQELFRFILFAPKVDAVVLFTGINNILLHTISPYFSEFYGAVFGQDAFQRLNRFRSNSDLMKHMLSRAPGLIKKELLGMFSRGRNAGEKVVLPDFEDRYTQSLKILARDLDVWASLKDAQGFSLMFMLQPHVSWMSKTLSPEEEELIGLYHQIAQQPERFGPLWLQMNDNVHQTYSRYREDTQNLCEAQGIPWFDCNELLSKEGWLFCDLIHLTDDGQDQAAKLIGSRTELRS